MGSFEKCWRLENGAWTLYKTGTEETFFSEIFTMELGEYLGLPMARYSLKDGAVASPDFTDGTFNYEPAANLVYDDDDYSLNYDSLRSKAALVVNNTPKVVDIRECGYNARDAIISICQCGEIVMEDPSISICDVSGGVPVSVVIEGRTFQTIADVNTYIFEERMARFCGTEYET